MDDINGYGVIGLVYNADGAVFLGERYKNGSTVLEYVVAFVPYGAHSFSELSSEWINGRYFDGPNTRQNRTLARDAFITRLSDTIWV